MNFSEIIKKLRKDKGLTQQQLADEIGLSKSAIVHYENNNRVPNFEAMTKLQKYFKVSASYLNGESEFNDYQNSQSELIDTIETTILEFAGLNEHLKKLPPEDQLEAYTFLNVSVDLLLNERIDINKSFEYYSVLNSIQLGVHDFIRFLNQAQKHKEPFDVSSITNKFSQLIIKSLKDLCEVYEFKVNEEKEFKKRE